MDRRRYLINPYYKVRLSEKAVVLTSYKANDFFQSCKQARIEENNKLINKYFKNETCNNKQGME